MDITSLTALELGKKIKAGEISAVEATKASLDRIKVVDQTYNAYISVCENAMAQAENVQKLISEGTLISPLAGVPVAIKDNISTKGTLTTCGSKILSNYKPVFNATVVDKLEAAGAIVIGKLNMDEFAMGSTSETSYFGVTKNPWDITRVPGGSSGGAAASVAANEAFYSLGSDTGGSIRQPAGFCGVTGIKPTYGSVSRFGLIAYASSLDQIGPLARNVEDCAAALSIISGYDAKDSTCMNHPSFDFSDSLVSDVKGMKIGIPTDYLGEGIEPEVKARILEAAKTFEAMGAHVEEFSLSLADYAIPAYYIIASAEASSNLSRFDGIKYGYRTDGAEDLASLYLKSRSEGFGAEVQRRIMLGAFVLSSGYYDAYYKKALQVKTLIKGAFDKAFQKYDLILGPVAPTTALPIGHNLSDPLKMYLGDIYTVSINIAGLPGMVVPCGFDSNNLPVGLQLIGKHFDEKTIMRAAYTFQQGTNFHRKSPVAVGKEA
jgi:aspartyl-tRNA(Asn)/glutamyl-tRNA(Gln) amidotransferase subunit A